MVQANELSEISDYDFVCLVANYNYLVDSDKTEVSSKVTNRGYTEKQLQALNKKFTDKFNPIVSCNLRFTKPFDHLKYEPISYVLDLYEAYEKGILPFPGSTSEQPAQIMQILSVIKQLKIEAEIRAHEKLNKNGRNQYQN